MSGKSFFKNSALGALAVAMIATALPATAFAQDQQRQERGGRSWGGGQRDGGQQRGDGQRGGGDYRAQAYRQAQQRTEQAPQPRVIQPGQPARVERPATQNWQGRGNAENAPRWGSQDRSTTERPGRDWQRGTVNRPATADRAATPRTPERGWDGNRWNGSGQSRTETRDVNRDRDRNWSEANRDRGTTWSGRNPSYSDRDRNQNYRGDNNYRGDSWRGNDRNGQRWNNDWRRDNRYNWSSYRSSNRNHYRMPRYYSPYRGYNYSRLSIGFFLNSGFYGNNYWINDPWSYRLPPAYAGYRWVRYYDDVLLVDTYSGEVVDVIYDFFW